ncbi:uncharacterized protein LOC143028893 [Oratosquilla oratoria]|uniref:uncharacterized protein LOC143028893 n=1 Tax=Oratosquilla oratoria TaxID=337810 RepID=UPI003F75D2D5
MQDTWLTEKANEIQTYADGKDFKKYYSALKAVYGPTSSGSSPVLTGDGNSVISDKEKILERWVEHFCSVLNQPSTINDEAIARLPHVLVNDSLSDPPTKEEVTKAIKHMSSGKAPGADSIPAEIYAFGGSKLTENLTSLFCFMWSKEKLPQEFKGASIVHLYKSKGNKYACDNHCGISLLSITGKILARIMLITVSMHIWNATCSLRVSVDFARDAAQRTSSSQPENSKRSARSRTLACAPPSWT